MEPRSSNFTLRQRWPKEMGSCISGIHAMLENPKATYHTLLASEATLWKTAHKSDRCSNAFCRIWGGEDPTNYTTLENHWLVKAWEIASIRFNSISRKKRSNWIQNAVQSMCLSDLRLTWTTLKLSDEDLEGKAQEKGLATYLPPT